MSSLAQSASAWAALSYLIGAIPMGVLVARLKGIDLRTVGSGNIGATNAARALGTKLGLAVFALDVVKAATPVVLARQSWALGSSPEAQPGLALVAMAAIVGHIFPLYLRFRGGKGVACALGVFVGLDPPVALAAAVMYGQGMWLTRISAVGSLTAVTSITMCVLIADKPWAHQVLAVAAALLIWARHASNIRELVAQAKARKRAAKSADPA